MGGGGEADSGSVSFKHGEWRILGLFVEQKVCLITTQTSSPTPKSPRRKMLDKHMHPNTHTGDEKHVDQRKSDANYILYKR